MNNPAKDEVLDATDRFYREAEGFGYDIEYVKKWIDLLVTVPKRGRVLDLCCGDGVWSRGFQLLAPKLELYGIDISAGGIEKARGLLGLGPDRFIVGDTEKSLPFTKAHFDIIYARGPGLFNQHDMSHPEAVAVIEMWHEYLSDTGRFYSIYTSRPDRIGSYTAAEKVVLPMNMAPRDTGATKFNGGKYHHSIESFHAPFWKAKNVKILNYRFLGNQHVLVTQRAS